MRIVKVSEALALEVGEKIPVLRGVIGRIYDRSTGTNEFGPWAIQKIEVADEQDLNKKVLVKLFDCEEVFAKQKNTVIVIESGNGQKGLTGVEVVEDTYKKKPDAPIKKMIQVRGLKADKPGATITIGGQAPAAAPAQPAAAAASQPAKTNQPAQQPATTSAPAAAAPPADDSKKPKPPHPPVHGQTVGMAIKEAIALTRSVHPNVVVGSRNFWQIVNEFSSDIIRISDRLGDGWLAPSAKDREIAAQKEADKTKPAGQ